MYHFFGYVLGPIEITLAILFLFLLEYIFFAHNWIFLTEMGVKNPWRLVIGLSIFQLAVVVLWVIYP